jgi:hypothetical protein
VPLATRACWPWADTITYRFRPAPRSRPARCRALRRGSPDSLRGMIRKLVGQLLGAAILLGVLFGLLVLVFMPFELRRMADARPWPFREGVVTKSVVSPQASFRKTFWGPVIRVTYHDTGEEFWVSRIRYGEFKTRTGKASAEADIARYRPRTLRAVDDDDRHVDRRRDRPPPAGRVVPRSEASVELTLQRWQDATVRALPMT